MKYLACVWPHLIYPIYQYYQSCCQFLVYHNIIIQAFVHFFQFMFYNEYIPLFLSENNLDKWFLKLEKQGHTNCKHLINE